MPDAARAPLPGTSAEVRRANHWEWFWRFLALALLLATAWVVWVALQMNPTQLATPAAFEAAERAASHSVAGSLSRVPAVAPPGEAQAQARGAQPADALSLPYPPVDLNRLRRSDALSTVSPEKLAKPGAVPKPDGGQ